MRKRIEFPGGSGGKDPALSLVWLGLNPWPEKGENPLGLLVRDIASMQIPFAAVNRESVPKRPFLRNRFKIETTFISVDLVHRNRKLVSFAGDNLGTIIIFCNISKDDAITNNTLTNINSLKKKLKSLVPLGVNLLKNS